jgi:hypothetical protein
MTHDVIRLLIDDYISGDLDPQARARVAEHLSACAICSAEAESLQRVLAQASELPKSVEPPREAWDDIRAAILSDQSALAEAGKPARLHFWQKPSAIAAAVLIAALISSGGTYLYVLGRDARNGSVAGNSTSQTTPASLAAFTIEENNYLRTASMLQDLLDQQQDALAPETVAQLKASLRTIDEAILEARNALARDPANKMLVEMLSASYRQKVDLLRRTTEMTRGS